MNHGAAGGFCIICGQALDRAHHFCPACGEPRWIPPRPPGDAARPPPQPGTPAMTAQPPEARRRATPPRALPWFFAAAAVVWLVSAVQSAAVVSSSAGRAQLAQQLTAGGFGAAGRSTVVAVGIGQVLFFLVAAGLHGTAYYGLRARSRWGWLVAVLVAGLWSLVIVGIPLLILLLRRDTRAAYGVD